MNRVHDYEVLEREFVAGNMSVRELARLHKISNASVVHVQAKSREWVRKRDEYRQRASERAIEFMADQEGLRRAKEMVVRDEAIDAIHQAVLKMKEDMKATHQVKKGDDWVDEPVMRIGPRDLAILIDRLNLLFGRPTTISEERTLGVTISSELPLELVQQIADVARERGSDARAVGTSPLPRLAGAGVGR